MTNDLLDPIAQAGIVIDPPAGFVPCAVQTEPGFPYGQAWRSPDGKIELRSHVVLAGSAQAADERESAREIVRLIGRGPSLITAADAYALDQLFLDVLKLLSGRNMGPAVSVLPPGHAEALFNADWASLCFTRIADAKFAAGYDMACVHYLHKDGVADVYLIGLYQEGSGVEVFFDEPPEIRFGSQVRCTGSPQSNDFDALLAEVGVEVIAPPGFVRMPPQPNEAFSYQCAYRSPDGALELRYRIDSFKCIEEERWQLNAGAEVQPGADMNSLHEPAFLALVSNLSLGEALPEVMATGGEQSQAQFGADWFAFCCFILPDPELMPGFTSAYTYCFHKRDVADVYLLAVCNELKAYESHLDVTGLLLRGFRFL